jgi:hypothetical protein
MPSWLLTLRCSGTQVTEMQANGVWKAGGPTLKVFGVLSQRVGKYITMQIDARFGKMMRDREAELLHEEEQAAFGWPQVDDGGAGGDGAAGGGVALLDEEDPEPSPLYVACEQHASGLLTRFLADSVRTLMPGHHIARSGTSPMLRIAQSRSSTSTKQAPRLELERYSSSRTHFCSLVVARCRSSKRRRQQRLRWILLGSNSLNQRQCTVV